MATNENRSVGKELTAIIYMAVAVPVERKKHIIRVRKSPAKMIQRTVSIEIETNRRI